MLSFGLVLNEAHRCVVYGWSCTPRPIKLAAVSMCVAYVSVRVARLVGNKIPDALRDDSVARARRMVTEVAGLICAPFTIYHECVSVRRIWQQNMRLDVLRVTPGHSHGVCAAARSAASLAMDNFILGLACVPYVVSSCGRDDPMNPAYHQWFIGKDVAFRRRNDPVPDNAIIKMVDVDYYVEWSYWVQYKRPIMIYTFVPDDVMYSDSEYSYALTPTGVIMEVSGGRRYEHRMWNYSADHVIVWTRWVEWTLCSIDSKMVDRHHHLVLINPICTVRWFGWVLPEYRMTRMNYGYGGGIMHCYRTGKYEIAKTDDDGERIEYLSGDVVSLGLEQNGRAITSATLPTALWCAIQIRIRRSKHPNVSDVERYLRSEGRGKTASRDAPPLFEIALGNVDIPLSVISHNPGRFEVLRFQAVTGLVTEDGKELGRAVCPSLVTNPDVVPNRSWNNDLASITGRVDKVVNNHVPPSRYVKYAWEFVRAVVGDAAGKGMPLDLSEVAELQDRPTQRGRFSQVMHWIGAVNPVKVRAFMKGESYARPCDPRNISTVGAEHTSRLSAYTYPYKYDVLYPKLWYAPGKPPWMVADRIVDLFQAFAVLSETDYSRFDGTINLWLREHVERASYLLWCSPKFRADLGELLSAEINPRACTSNGLPYDPQASRLSGSPLTTDGNTEINGFVSYSAAREAGMSPEKAMSLLGSHGGDDGVSPIKPAWLVKAASDLGLKLKCVRRDNGITFLGRLFYNSSNGQRGSIQDPLRTWRKLHISFAPAYITDRQALANRAAGYRSLDPEAPVIKEWTAKVQELTGLEGSIDSDSPYFAQIAEKYPEFGGWPQLPYSDALEAIAWRLDVGVDEVADFATRVAMAVDLDGLYHLWDNPPADSTITVVLDGEVREGPPSRSASILTLPTAPRIASGSRQARNRVLQPTRGGRPAQLRKGAR